ncbi:MAG: peroxiredoxin [Bifidobacteriaceae bacterium]|nr:peroxiredoxin [Bifidobacteriaceae bacterium]
MSSLNTRIPEFNATAYADGNFRDVSDQHLLGGWSVVFFYPADFSFVCPTELADLAALYADFKEAQTEIYSVSTDTHFSHKAWHDTSDAIGTIEFPMVGDPSGQITRGFGVMIEETGLAERATFLINPEGIIKAIEISDGAVGRDARDLLRKVKAAQWVAANPEEVCPARWVLGADTLKPSAALVGQI